MVVRGRGPSLAEFGVEGVLADPVLQLFDADGVLMDSNASWVLHPTVSFLPLRLTPDDALEAAMTLTLEPGAYTAILRGASASTGIGIVEVFDVTEE